MNDVQVDLDAVNPVMSNTEPVEVEDSKVVFVAHKDTPLRINQTEKLLKAGVGTKVTRDEARILLEAKAGYIK